MVQQRYEPTAAVFRPVRTGNTFEETVERLLQAIKLGLVREGERLPSERDLAGQLAVSRTTLREAIHELQSAGYVDSRRGRAGGTFVTYRPEEHLPVRQPRPDVAAELTDALALRRALEPGAAELCARRVLSGAERQRLLTSQADCTTTGADGYRVADSRLHLAVAELAGSPSLAAAVADVRMRINDLLDTIPLLPRNIAHSDAQHAQVVAAILSSAPDAARTAMAEHVDGTAALLRGFLG